MVELLPPEFVAKLGGGGTRANGAPWTFVNYEASDQRTMEFSAAVLVNSSEHEWLSSYFERLA